MFGEAEDQAVVIRQPDGPDELRDAARAMLACPTASIGVRGRKPSTQGLFPQLLAPGLYYCGFTSPLSFGANSYFVEGVEGGLLVDSPRFVAPLRRALETAGGVRHILLTHGDDVADAERYARHFRARVWIHEGDDRAAPFATDILRGRDILDIAPSLTVIPVPGHTRGSVVYLVRGEILFSGDSLHWSRRFGRLSAFRDACWYSWEEQTRSLARLAEHSFTWVLPGHGNRAQGSPTQWRRELLDLVRRMESGSDVSAW